MKCHTSCLYCYADRAHHQYCQMSSEKISSIIDEANQLGVVSFKIMGGDIFTYKDWPVILKKLNSYNYSPCISTKMPLKENDVRILKELIVDGLPIQISLDSLMSGSISKILRVDGYKYLTEMISFIELLEKYKMDYTIHTVLCNINDNISDIQSIEEFIEDKKYIREWYVDSAKCSMYLPYKYSSYKPNKNKVLAIAIYMEQIRDCYPEVKIHAPRILRSHNNISKDMKHRIFDNRVSCSGNLSSMYILPDGKVTLCEELYWHPKFILGDLNKNSIAEVWNSEKAVNLFFLNQSELSSKSACATCSDFKKCRSCKHVCWRDVILAFGHKNWDFPDPFCPHAPLITNDFSME